MAATIRRRLFLGVATLPFLAGGLGSPTFAATVAELSEELRMAEVRLRIARERYAKGEIPLKYVRDRESEVEAARSALQAAQKGSSTSTAQSSSNTQTSTASASSSEIAALEEELRMAEVRLRVARERYAKGEIPLKNVEARESEVEAARSALQSAQGGGSTSSGQSSSNTQTSTASASSSEIAALEEEVRQRQVALRVAEERYADGRIPYSNVDARKRELQEAEAALARARGSSGNSNVSSGNSDGGNGNKQYVSSGSQLASALRNAAPGAHIVLLNGSYSGSFTINTDGTSSRPIRIEAANRGGVSLTSDLNLYGAYIQVLGLAFKGCSVAVRRDNCQISRCSFLNCSVAISARGAANLEIDYNEFHNWRERAIDIDPIYNGFSGHNPHIHHNYLYKCSSSATLGITVGHQPSHTDRNVNAIIEYNLIESCDIDQLILIKTSSNVVRYNTVLGGGAILNRHGKNNLYLGNYTSNSKGIWLSDINNEARDNRLENSPLQVLGGDITSSQLKSQTGGHPRSERAKLVDNYAKDTIVGRTYGNWNPKLPAIQTQIDGHRGSISYGLQQGTVTRDTSSSSAGNGARQISRGQVGPSG